MSDTTFVSGTTLTSPWLNDINDAIYHAIGNGTTAPTTPAEVVANLGIVPGSGSDFLKVTDYGSVGTADDTTVVQTALNAASTFKKVLMFTTATYTVLPITVPSNVVIFMEPGALIKAKTGYGANDRLLNIVDVTNVTIFGNGASIQMLKAEYVTGEQRHAVFITGSTDVRIYDLIAKDSGGDGYYIGRTAGAGTHCVRINLIGVQSINNRRQGLSIVSGDTINVVNSTFRDTIGTPPAYGIDIEPNDSLDVIKSINITNVKTSGNQGGGIIWALQAIGATAANEVSINVNGWLSDGDGDNAANTANAGFRVTGNGTGAWAFPVRGIVKLSNFEIRNPKSSGIWNTYWTSSNTPYLLIEDGVIVNPGSSSPTNDEDKCGVVIWGYNVGGQNFGNIEINRVKVRDTRGTAATYSPVYIYKTVGATGVGQADTVRLHDVMGEGFTPLSTGQGHVVTIVDMDHSSITYSLEQVVSNIANDVNRTRGFAGYTITCNTSGVNTLPKASTNRGLSYKFLNLATNQTLQVRPTTGDTLDYCGTIANKDMVLSVYSGYVVYTATDQPSDFYRADAIHELAKRPLLCGESTRPPTNKVYVTAMPTTGTWGMGDEAWLFQKAAGAPYFWFRLTTGSANVLGVDWKASPNL